METKSSQIIASFDNKHNTKTVYRKKVDKSFEITKCDTSDTSDENSMFNWKLIGFDDLPDWMKDNEYIRSYYRPALKSYEQCLWSAFRVHNQTTNIWSHALAALLFNFIFVNQFPEHLIASEDRLVYSLVYLGTVLCFYGSIIFHTFLCHSEGFASTVAKVDYIGITIHIFGNNYGLSYFTFYCDSYKFKSFITFVTIFFVFCLIVNNLSFFDRNTSFCRILRAITFFSFGFASIVPQIYWLSVSVNHTKSWHSIQLLILMDIFYVLGAVVYASRIPERYFIGKCDLFHSHMWFHMLQSAGSYFSYKSIAEIALQNSVCL